MANIRTRNQLDIFNRLDQRFNEIGLTYDGYDSFRNILSDIISSELSALNNEFYSKFQDLQLSNASENALDEIAEDLFNLSRLPAARASSFIPEQNVQFFINEKRTENITIPAGTKISTINSFEEEDFYFETTDDAEISPGELETYVNVIAVKTGASSNTGEFTLAYWENENITQVDSTELSCRNTFPIINGADLESDRDFRTRCSLYIESSIAKNADFISKSLYEVPGVLEAVQHQGYYGLGTTAYSARGSGRFSNPSFKRIIEQRMNQLLRTGESIKIVDDIVVLFEVELDILTRRSYSEEEITTIKNEIKSKIEEEFLLNTQIINFSEISTTVSNLLQADFSFRSSDAGTIFKKIVVQKNANRYLGEGDNNLFKDKLVSTSYALKTYEVAKISNVIVNIEEV